MKEEKEVSLTEFIEKNQATITVFGVFVAVTTFSLNMPIKSIGNMLAFIFSTLAILLWFEIWEHFPAKRGTWKLIFFENILAYSTIMLVGYWLVDFRSIWDWALPLLITFILMAIVSTSMKRWNIFNRLFNCKPNENKILRHGLGITILITSMIGAYFLAQVIAKPINSILDEVYEAELINETKDEIETESVNSNSASPQPYSSAEMNTTGK